MELDGRCVETANGTSWSSLKVWLTQTTAHIVFGQELRLSKEDVDAASKWAIDAGWKTLWAWSLPTAAGGKSAGVVLCVRSWMGLGLPPAGDDIIVGHRVVAGRVQAPGWPDVICYSAYFYCSEGMTDRNAGIFGKSENMLKATG